MAGGGFIYLCMHAGGRQGTEINDGWVGPLKFYRLLYPLLGGRADEQWC